MTMQNGIFGGDFLEGVFGAEPRLPYFGALQNKQLSPIQNRFFQTQFQPFFDRFTGSTANFLQRGGPGGGRGDPAKTPTFQDFINNINFGQEFGAMPSSIRPGGSNQTRFSPPTRFLF